MTEELRARLMGVKLTKKEKLIAEFNTEEERIKWLNENCKFDYSCGYLKDTGERIAIYEY